MDAFWADWGRGMFGGDAGFAAGRTIQELDGGHLGINALIGGGARTTDAQIAEFFAPLRELEALRPRIKGAGNLERFDYWLNTHRGAATMAEVSCLRGQLDRQMAGKKYDEALATRIELAKAWTRLMTLQTAIVSTPGELGTIANLEQHSRRQMHFVDGHDAALEKALGKPLPAEAQPGKDYTGPAKIIVPTVRSVIRQGETLKIPVIVLDNAPAKNAALHFRVMAHGNWQEFPLEHVGRAVYRVELPGVQEAMEYYITAETATGQKLVWPATAPALNQTVVTMP